MQHLLQKGDLGLHIFCPKLTNKLLKFCDLEWDQNCLEHDKNKSAIKTASISQARKPIYKSSVNLSDNYSKYLNEMFGLLKN